jgi:hypothetical protein
VTRLIDDRTLSAVLRGALSFDGLVYTTGLWYLRLCQAVLGATRPPTGQLSKPIASLPADMRDAAIRSVLELPDEIHMLDLRTLAPTMAAHRERHRLNLLSTEALAAATISGAKVVLSAASPRLEAALDSEGIAVQRMKVG